MSTSTERFNDPFERKVRAAGAATWWVVLVAVAFLTLQWLIYLAVSSNRPEWLLTLWGPEIAWPFVLNLWFWVMAIFKMFIWLLALIALWLTLWARQMRKLSRREGA